MNRKAKSQEPATAPSQLRTVVGRKTNVGILIDAELWRKFKIHCLENFLAPGDTVAGLLEDFMKKR